MAFTASMAIVFIAGIMWGMHMSRSNQETYGSDSSALGKATSVSTSTEDITHRKKERRTDTPSASPMQDEIIGNIRNAMLLPKDSRTAPLLKALEQTTKLPLSKVLLDKLRLIVDEGEIDADGESAKAHGDGVGIGRHVAQGADGQRTDRESGVLADAHVAADIRRGAAGRIEAGERSADRGDTERCEYSGEQHSECLHRKFGGS